jgi:hypothetical protein
VSDQRRYIEHRRAQGNVHGLFLVGDLDRLCAVHGEVISDELSSEIDHNVRTTCWTIRACCNAILSLTNLCTKLGQQAEAPTRRLTPTFCGLDTDHSLND